MTIKGGDLVLCIDNLAASFLQKGKVYKVEKVASNGFLYLDLPDEHNVIPYNYNRFQPLASVGQSVRCIDNLGVEEELQVGTIYQIDDVADNGNYRFKEKDGAWFMPRRFQLADDATPSPAPEVTAATTPNVISEKPFDFDTYNSVLPGRR